MPRGVDLDDVRRHIEEVPGQWVHDLHAWDYYGRRIAPRARLRQGMEAEPDEIMPLSPRGSTSQASRDRDPRSRETLRMARARAKRSRCARRAAHNCGPGIARIHFAFWLLQSRPTPQSYVSSDRGVMWSTF
jgi:hypothetical protein